MILSTSPTLVAAGSVQVLKNQSEIAVKKRVARIELSGLRIAGYPDLMRIENNGQAENKANEAIANMRCISEELSCEGVVK